MKVVETDNRDGDENGDERCVINEVLEYVCDELADVYVQREAAYAECSNLDKVMQDLNRIRDVLEKMLYNENPK